jgi:hypothetical protein
MTMYAVNWLELNCRQWKWTLTDLNYQRPYWTKPAWMNGRQIWLKAYPRNGNLVEQSSPEPRYGTWDNWLKAK